jgi:hypothetical protein
MAEDAMFERCISLCFVVFTKGAEVWMTRFLRAI